MILPKAGVDIFTGPRQESNNRQVKMICKLYERYKDENRDHCGRFSVIFETASKFLIFFDGVTGPRQEIDIRYECDLKIILKYLGCK